MSMVMDKILMCNVTRQHSLHVVRVASTKAISILTSASCKHVSILKMWLYY